MALIIPVAERQARRSAFEILDRLQDEVVVNVSAATEANDKIALGNDVRDRARTALVNCEADDAAVSDINQAIGSMVSDIVPGFVESTANELARSDQYFKFLTPEFRTAFNKYIARLADEKEQLGVNFGLMWDNHVFRHEAVGFSFGDTAIEGNFTLAQPVEILCRDADFQRKFGLSEIFHATSTLRLDRFVSESETFLEVLATERDRR